jgi:protein gp37
MTDVFGEWVTDEQLDRLFAVMALTPQHTYQVLTKRAERMRAYVAEHCPSLSRRTGGLNIPLSLAMTASNERRFSVAATWPLPNVWLGVSAEDQKRADERIPDLLATPAAVRFVSYEPALGPADFYRFLHDSNCPAEDLDGDPFCICSAPREINLDWIIVGGESGPGARSFNITWARDVVEQCQGAGVAVFVKQLGAKPYTSDLGGLAFPMHIQRTHDVYGEVYVHLKSHKGGDPSEWPADLRVREFPRNGSKQQ